MPLVINNTYYLELNSVPLACPAWEVTNLEVLLADDQAVRGSDRILPGAAGRRALPRVLDATVYTLGLEIWGQVDVDGAAIADPGAGLIAHLDYLKANLGLAAGSADGTVPAELHRGSASTLIADVHFLGFKGSALTPPAFLRTTFDISVPYGWEAAP